MPRRKDEEDAVPQSGVVAYRLQGGEPVFCLITSSKGKWGFPKGLIDPGETPVEAALKEALEEAGLHGEVEEEPLGQYPYRKWGVRLLVTIYLMRVTRAARDWPEAGWRRRQWCSAKEARKLLDREELRPFLAAALQRVQAAAVGSS